MSVLHTEFRPDEGTLTAERFAALQTSTAVKPEDSVSPSSGTREEGSPVAAGAAGAVNSFACAADAPVTGRIGPVRRKWGNRSLRYRTVLRSASRDRPCCDFATPPPGCAFGPGCDQRCPTN